MFQLNMLFYTRDVTARSHKHTHTKRMYCATNKVNIAQNQQTMTTMILIFGQNKAGPYRLKLDERRKPVIILTIHTPT